MTTEEFVRELAKCAPDIAGLLKDGLSVDDAKEYRDMFFCKPKPAGRKLADPLLNLLSVYDVSQVDIGGIHFLDPPEEIDEGWIVAEEESDPIILDRRSGELYYEHFDLPGEVAMKCARDSGRFLEALVEAGCFLETRTVRGSEKDQRERLAQARKCAEIAGGEDYLDFYLALVA